MCVCVEKYVCVCLTARALKSPWTNWAVWTHCFIEAGMPSGHHGYFVPQLPIGGTLADANIGGRRNLWLPSGLVCFNLSLT